MAMNHNAFLRLVLIDKIISTQRFGRTELVKSLNRKLLEQGQEPVCESSLDKDIRRMKEIFNAPIKNVNGTYCYTQKNFRLFSLDLDKEELEILSLSIDWISTQKIFPFHEKLVSILERFFLKAAQKERVGGGFEDTDAEPGPGNRWIQEIHQSITKQSPITIHHHSNGTCHMEKVSPGKLVDRSGEWLLKGYSHNQEQEVEIPLDMISNLTPCTGLNYRQYFHFKTIEYKCEAFQPVSTITLERPARKRKERFLPARPGRNTRPSRQNTKKGQKLKFPFMELVLN